MGTLFLSGFFCKSSIFFLFPSVFSLNNLKLHVHKIYAVKSIFIHKEKKMYALVNFDAELA